MASAGVGSLTIWFVPPWRYWTCHVMAILNHGHTGVVHNPKGQSLLPLRATNAASSVPYDDRYCQPRARRLTVEAANLRRRKNGRITSESGRGGSQPARPRSAKRRYITSLSFARLVCPRQQRPGGTVRPSLLAVVRLTISSNLVGGANGSSPGAAPFNTF